MKHFDEDEKCYVILEPSEYSMVGYPNDDGDGINFQNTEEEDAHKERITE